MQQNQAWRNNSGQAQPTTQPQTPTQQTAQQQSQMIYEESGDGIVPSTPTLYVPRRADGFSEAVSSPQPQVCISTSFASNFISFQFCSNNMNFRFIPIRLTHNNISNRWPDSHSPSQHGQLTVLMIHVSI